MEEIGTGGGWEVIHTSGWVVNRESAYVKKGGRQGRPLGSGQCGTGIYLSGGFFFLGGRAGGSGRGSPILVKAPVALRNLMKS